MKDATLRELIVKFANEMAPSGQERALQATLLAEVEGVADEITVDRLGNGIATKHGVGKHVALIAHVDEPGVMVVDIEENGFLRLISIGNLSPVNLANRQVNFMGGVIGLIELEHGVDYKDATFDHLYVDIGATSKADAASRIEIGASGVIVSDVTYLGDHRLVGRALDNRVGCALAVSAFRALAQAGHRVSLVLTSQNRVGARGAKTAAYQVQPDFALIIDAAQTGDVPGSKGTSLRLGAGPAVKILDGTAIVPLEVKDLLIAAAKSEEIAIQYEVSATRPSDAGAVQLSVDGIPMGGISYPARHVGSNQSVVDLNDIEDALQLTIASVKRFQSELSD